MLKVKKAYIPNPHENRCFVQTLDGRTAYFLTPLPPRPVKETNLHYCHPMFKLRGRRAEEIIPDSTMGLWLLQYKIEIEGGKYPAKWRE